MPSELIVHAKRVQDLHFVVHAREHAIHIDYSLDPERGAEAGATPLETVLAALAVCSGDTLNLLFQAQGLPAEVVHVTAKGTRRDEHPTVLTHIELVFALKGNEGDSAAVEAVLSLAQNKICPVWVMLGAAAEISASYRFAET